MSGSPPRFPRGKTKSGGPAFPSHGGDFPGMSLRDYFAAKAVEMMSRWATPHQGSHGQIARDAYALADAMLEAREGE